MKEITISKFDEGKRVDKYVRSFLNKAPLSFIYKLFRKKDIKINNKPIDISYILKENDILRIYVNDEQLKEFNKPKNIEKIKSDLDIIYEDENILVINKPRGILIHGDEDEKRITLTNKVLNYLYNKKEFNPANNSFTPSPAHRLDRNTSGIVIFGKKVTILQELFKLFQKKDSLSKHYYLLVEGVIKKDGVLDFPLSKDETKGIVKVSESGKTAITKYCVKENFLDKTLIDAELITGRTHQLRVHFAYFKHPICGDSKYGDFAKNKKFKKEFAFDDQFLHAYSLEFKELNGQLKYLSGKKFIAKLPYNEEEILNKLRGTK